MAVSDRPTGLTALAIANFIWVGIHLCISLPATVFGWIAIPRWVSGEWEHPDPEAFERIRDVLDMEKFGLLMGTQTAFYCFALLVLTVAGIGYIKQKRVMGWMLGNFYGVVGAACLATLAVNVPAEIGGGFTVGVFLSVFYPLFTLILLNFVFRRDLTR